MKLSEAKRIVAEIERDYLQHIEAQIAEGQDGRYRVNLLLRTERRRTFVWTPDQWHGLKEAWQWFLPRKSRQLPQPPERMDSHV